MKKENEWEHKSDALFPSEKDKQPEEDYKFNHEATKFMKPLD